MGRADEDLAVEKLPNSAVAKKRLFRVVVVTAEFRILHCEIVSTLLRKMANGSDRNRQMSSTALLL